MPSALWRWHRRRRLAGALTDAGETPIPEPFDAVPTLEEPPERLRSIAGVVFPPGAVPEEGPIPDVHHSHTEAVEITVPPWAFEAV
ncbi:hypothetical protein ACFQL0_22670, partial [Haloplanus litoreus]|uniref:hypothetical protein n=1 Tax=Haloplanus litoreus TaxID=767515 RepID=UPI00360ED9DA